MVSGRNRARGCQYESEKQGGLRNIQSFQQQLEDLAEIKCLS